MTAIIVCVLGAATCVLPGGVAQYRVSVPVKDERTCRDVVHSAMQQMGQDPKKFVVRCVHK